MSFLEVRCSVLSSAIPLPPHQLLTIYRGLVRPCMEYACHVWGGLRHTALLDRVESKAFRLISFPPLTSCLLPLKSRCSDASLSIFYRYFHANCSSVLANCMPPLFPRPCCTRLSSQAHPYTVQTPFAKVNQYLHSFFLVTGKLEDRKFPPKKIPPTKIPHRNFHPRTLHACKIPPKKFSPTSDKT